MNKRMTTNYFKREKLDSVEEFLEKVLKISAVIVAIFGSGFAALGGFNSLILEHESVRSILAVCFILFLGLLWFNIHKWWRQGLIFIDPLDLAAKKFGFKYNRMNIETEIYIDGSFIFTRDIELEVVDYELDLIEYRAIVLGDNKLTDPDIKVSGDAGDSKIYCRIIQKGDKSIMYVVDFSPALKKGEKVTYKIIERYGPGGYAMDRDFISEMIKKREWRHNEPYEEETSKIVYPIKKLIKKTILPVGYNVSGREYWDVLIGDGNNRAIGEYNRIKKKENEYFSKEELDNKTILKLAVDKPEIGLSYCLKWVPPSREEYEKLLKENSQKRNKPITASENN